MEYQCVINLIKKFSECSEFLSYLNIKYIPVYEERKKKKN